MSRKNAWGDYWQKAGLTTFGDKPTYQGEVRSLWLQLAKEMDDGAVVVDLGAGNGGLEEILQEYSNRKSKALTIHAVDAAKLQPKVTSGTDATCRIVWHEQTLNEATGLDDATVDVAVSIFGFEYGDTHNTVAELQRIMKPKARCRFMMHHSDSVLIRDTAGELAVLEDALENGGIFDATHDFLKEYGNIRKPSQHRKMLDSPAGERLLRAITKAMNRAAVKATTPNGQALLESLSKGVAQIITPPVLFNSKDYLLDSISSVRKAYEANLARLQDMREASVGKDRLNEIRTALEAIGFHVESSPFCVQGLDNPVAWLLDATR